jgi:branched-chain amino acid transport system permease protein
MAYLVNALLAGLLLGGLYALMAIGVSLVFGVARIVNFAHGEFVMLGGYAAYWLYVLLGLDPLLSLPLVALGLLVVGSLVYAAVVARILEAPHLAQIMLTFGIHLVLQNMALILWTADVRSVVTAYSTLPMTFGPVSVGVGRLIAAVISLLLIVVLFVWLHRTYPGRAVRAVAQDAVGARLSGVPIRRINMLAFGISAALGGAAGGITSFILSVTPHVGTYYLIKAFAVVILGGVGSLPGTLIGAMLLGVTESLAASYVGGGGLWAEGLGYLILLAVLIAKPEGLLGRRVIRA